MMANNRSMPKFMHFYVCLCGDHGQTKSPGNLLLYMNIDLRLQYKFWAQPVRAVEYTDFISAEK